MYDVSAELVAAEAPRKKRAHDDEISTEYSPLKRPRKASSTDSTIIDDSEDIGSKDVGFVDHVSGLDVEVPQTQKALLLLEKGQPYVLSGSQPVPTIEQEQEALVKILHVGLNPIDWKAPDYGFGIPKLPYLAGRDLVGVVMSISADQYASPEARQRIRKGDVVLSASTDYRDLRRAAYQQYAVATSFNLCRIPSFGKARNYAGLGVAFVAAALTMGICLGCNFSTLGLELQGPDLRNVLRGVEEQRIAKDVRDQCLRDLQSRDSPQPGDWIAIWGGSSSTAFIVAQLAKLLGLRVIKIVDVAKHGERLSAGFADLLVDSHNNERAVDIIRRVTNRRLRFAIDTVGKESATVLRDTLRTATDGHNDATAGQCHLVGLTGLPKDTREGILKHTVPIKLHHEIPEIGEALMVWLEALLRTGELVPPPVEVVDGGLEAISPALDRMRRGDVAGKRLVVSLLT